MLAVLNLLLVCAAVSFAATVPVKYETTVRSPLTQRDQAKGRVGTGRVVRNKRSMVWVEVPDEQLAPEPATLEEALSQLSNEELAAFANAVQQELDDIAPQQYELETIEVPDELLEQYYSRPRRGIPVEVLDDTDDSFDDVVIVPDDVIEEALLEEAAEEAAEQEAVEELAREEEEELNEFQLRLRISEMADILKERAGRRYARRR